MSRQISTKDSSTILSTAFSKHLPIIDRHISRKYTEEHCQSSTDCKTPRSDILKQRFAAIHIIDKVRALNSDSLIDEDPSPPILNNDSDAQNKFNFNTKQTLLKPSIARA